MKKRNLHHRKGPTRRLLREGLLLTLLVFFLPAAVFAVPVRPAAAESPAADVSVPDGGEAPAPAEESAPEPVKPSAPAEPSAPAKASAPGKSSPPAKASAPEETAGKGAKKRGPAPVLRVKLGRRVKRMDLEDYLWGVVAAEMPAAFHPEALRAQAIAARTYTLYRMEHPSPGHPGADICSDPGCCQAWISRKDRLAAWSRGERKKFARKITEAVEGTRGQVVCWRDRPIMAAFHASSAGRTRAARSVWGREVSYLQAVDSPEDKKGVPDYYSVVTVPAKRFRRVLLARWPGMKLGEDPGKWIGKTLRDESGLPVSIRVGGVKVPTAELRSLFGLRSACVTAECRGRKICLYVTGYGHGVGMSQYGADALAGKGKTAGAILRHYYTGVKVKKLY